MGGYCVMGGEGRVGGGDIGVWGGWGTIYLGLVINIGLVLIPNVCLTTPVGIILS